MTAKPLPRGVRNNNPGNIRHSGDRWQGKSPDQPDEAFVRFESMAFGVRALARVLIRYFDAYDLNTIAGIIERWAPPVENDTAAYITQVCKATGFDADQPLNLHQFEHMEPIVQAIIRHENGDPKAYGRKVWVEPDVIEEGLRRAGIVRPARKLAAEPESKTAAAVATGTAVTAGGAGYAYYEIKEAAADMRAAGKAEIEAGNASKGSLMVLGGVGILLVALAAMAILAYKRWRLRK